MLPRSAQSPSCGHGSSSLRKAGESKDRASVLAVYDLVAKPIMTFRQCAEAYIEAHKGSWSGPRHLHQWQTSLAQYAYAVLADLPVAEIDGNSKGTDLIMRVIEPLWFVEDGNGVASAWSHRERARLGYSARLSGWC
jgi:hypothetical protein